MLRVKSVPDPLPVNLEWIPETDSEAYLMRSLGTSFGSCGYQCKYFLIPSVALQVMVTLSLGVTDREDRDWASLMSPVEAVTTHRIVL